jgi:hypothetical protein
VGRCTRYTGCAKPTPVRRGRWRTVQGKQTKKKNTAEKRSNAATQEDRKKKIHEPTGNAPGYKIALPPPDHHNSLRQKKKPIPTTNVQDYAYVRARVKGRPTRCDSICGGCAKRAHLLSALHRQGGGGQQLLFHLCFASPTLLFSFSLFYADFLIALRISAFFVAPSRAIDFSFAKSLSACSVHLGLGVLE